MSARAPRPAALRSARRPRTDADTDTAVLDRPDSPRTRSRTVGRWNLSRSWRWIAGHWASRLELPVLGMGMGPGSGPRLTTQAVDEWRVDRAGVRIRALSGPFPGLPAAVNLVVGFARAGSPSLDLIAPSGTVTTLTALESTDRSITFQAPPVADDSGRSLRLTIERVGRSGLRIVAEWSDAPGAAPLFCYTARKLTGVRAA